MKHPQLIVDLSRYNTTKWGVRSREDEGDGGDKETDYCCLLPIPCSL
ncbi:MAG: hypothetical protein WA919_23355 [Coleofasciculaceae cyanobacterium]